MNPWQSLLTPALAMIVWSLAVWAWACATRIPAFRKAGVSPTATGETRALDSSPMPVRRAADNLLTDPTTISYALLFYAYLAGQQNGANLILAWAYVASRVADSLIAAAAKLTLIRFAVQVAGALALIVLAARLVIALFS